MKIKNELKILKISYPFQLKIITALGVRQTSL